MNQDLLKAILNSGDLYDDLQTLQKSWEEAQKRRHRFWAQVRDGQKVEFINGEVITRLPDAKATHQISKRLLIALATYIDAHQLGFLGFEKMRGRFTRNDDEPNICFWLPEKADGFEDGQRVFPPPDFIIEILSKNTENRDRGIKMEDYARHGLGEYWIIRPFEKVVEQYLLQGNVYHLQQKIQSGKIASQVIKGFVMAVDKIFGA
ncbi:MAG: Uma2 family endonuclease [Bacteroidota bacterium]